MTANRIFTRQIMGLDSRVLYVILGTVILCLGLLGYRLMDVKKCTPVSFSIKSIAVHTDSMYSAGETLSFISSGNKEEITWDFGDNSDKITGQYVTHVYVNTGSYQITASTGTSCETMKRIMVNRSLVTEEKNDNSFTGEEIVGPVSTLAGKEEIFTCMVTATAYEWSIPNYPKMIQKGSTAKFQFPTAGKYLVQVTLDHDRTKRYSKEITVEAAPIVKSEIPDDIKPLIPPGVIPLIPEVKSSVKISDAIFTGYLEKVIDKKMTAADFDDYLCYKGETKVILNGELLTFTAFCEEISGKKRRRKLIIGKTKIKIKSAEMRRDNDGCVNIIEVKYH